MQLLVGLQVHVVRNRIARVELLLDPLQARRQHHRRAEIWVRGHVHRSRLDPRGGHRDPQHVRAVVVAVGDVHRRPGESGHRACLDQPLVRVHRGGGDRADGRRMAQDPGDELVGERRDTAAPRVVGVGEQVLPGADIGERHVVVTAAAGPVGVRLGHERRFAAVLARERLGHHPPQDSRSAMPIASV